MKKYLCIIIATLSLSFTSHSYANEITAGVSCSGTVLGVLGSKSLWNRTLAASHRILQIENLLKKAMPAGRAYRLSKILVKATDNGKALAWSTAGAYTATTISSAVCLFSITNSVQAAAIVENPALAIQNDEDFKTLVSAVGTDAALAAVERIANNEKAEDVFASLLPLIAQSNANDDGFLDSSRESEIAP